MYAEFDRLSERGGVLGAMDTMYQRGKIQEESLLYERLKHTGELPLIGVNTFLPRDGRGERIDALELMRSTESEKQPADRQRPRLPGVRRPSAGPRRWRSSRTSRTTSGQRLRGADGHGEVRFARARSRPRFTRSAANTGATCSVTHERERNRSTPISPMRSAPCTSRPVPTPGSSAWCRASPS